MYGQPNYSTVPQGQPGAPMGAPNYAQEVAGGNFPYLNRVELVGQVFGNDQNPGIKWVPGRDGKDGHIQVKLKVRKSWNGRNGSGVKQTLVKLVAYGQLGQALGGQIRPGAMLKVCGELSISNFKSTQGQNAGSWVTEVQIQLRDGRDGRAPFEVIGLLPVYDEKAPPRNNGGYGGGNNNGGGGNNGGGYGNNGGNNNGGGNGGGGYPPANGGGYTPPANSGGGGGTYPPANNGGGYTPPPPPPSNPGAPNNGGTFAPPGNGAVPGAPGGNGGGYNNNNGGGQPPMTEDDIPF